MATPVIDAQGVGKKYNIYKRPTDRLKEMLLFGRLHRHQEHWALREVDFRVMPGETVGVVGSNGAGKSTLLKLITGISRPSEGSLAINGRISALMELGAGFHYDFSGRDNIAMNCSILGMGRQEIADKIDDIIAFSELGPFIDRPIRIYSTGMFMRLGFSVAVFTEPDILIIDEILAVGDEYFQSKCFRKIREFRDRGKTILFVSHSTNSVRGLCRRAVWLDKGRVVEDGESIQVTNRYLNFQRRRIGERLMLEVSTPHTEHLAEEMESAGLEAPPPVGTPHQAVLPLPALPATEGAPGVPLAPAASPRSLDQPGASPACPLLSPQTAPPAAPGPELPSSAEIPAQSPIGEILPPSAKAVETLSEEAVRPPRTGTREGEIWKVEFLDRTGRAKTTFDHGETLVVRLHFRANGHVPTPNLGVSIWRNDGILAYGTSTAKDSVSLPQLPAEGYLDFILDDCVLMSGEYEVSVAIFCPDDIHPYDFHDRLYPLQITSTRRDEGVNWIAHRYRYVTEGGRKVVEREAERHPKPQMTNAGPEHLP